MPEPEMVTCVCKKSIRYDKLKRHWSRTHRAQGPHPPRDLIRKISFQHGEEDVNSQTGNRPPRVPFAFTLATPPEPYTSRMEEGLDDDAQPPGDEVFENAGCPVYKLSLLRIAYKCW